MSSVKALSLDAFGTILELIPPAPALVRELRRGWGIAVSEAEAGRALAAEIRYYRAHQLEGRDESSLADLRLRCAGVLLENLPRAARERLTAAELLPAMMRSLRFRPFAEVPAALERFRERGLALAVVSNWDISLPQVLADCGLAPLIDHVVSSAEVGAAKPSPAPFQRALELLGVEPPAVIHIGDEPDLDVAGATAAGMRPVLIRRNGDPTVPDTRAPAAAAPDTAAAPAAAAPAAPGTGAPDPDIPVITNLADFIASEPHFSGNA